MRVGVRPEQRRPAGQVEVVRDHHERPGPVDGSTPPAAFVRTTIRAPSRWNSSTGWTTRPGIVALVHVEPALEHHDRRPAERPSRSRPTWPGAVAAASPAARRTGSRPDPRARRRGRPARSPRTMPDLGHESDRARTAASSASSRPAGPPAESAGVDAATSRSRACGPPETRPGGRRPRPASVKARRTYRHRDAGRSPSGGRRPARRTRPPVRTTKRPKRPARSGGP
jgi:hypothetical protein